MTNNLSDIAARINSGTPDHRNDYEKLVDYVNSSFAAFVASRMNLEFGSDNESVICRLVSALHLTPTQARDIAPQDWPLCLPEDWLSFWQTLDRKLQELLEGARECHPFPVPTTTSSS